MRRYVQSMEIDSDGLMWVVDVGRRNFAGGLPDNRCPPKILLIDTQTGQVWAVHPLPLDLNHSTSAFPRTRTRPRLRVHAKRAWYAHGVQVVDPPFVFPADVAPYSSSFLNDIVVDEVAQVAYISDAGARRLAACDRA